MNIDTAKRIIDTTPKLKDIECVEYLDEGFSSDEKYVLWKGGLPTYLLRISGNLHQERRRRDFDIMGQLYQRGVLCPEPRSG